MAVRGIRRSMNLPERGSVTRRTWGCSDALRLTEPRSHRVVRISWSQCMRKNEWGLTRNQPLPLSWPDRTSGPRPVPGRSVWSAPALLENHPRSRLCATAGGGDRPRSESDRFMVPMHARKRKGATHEAVFFVAERRLSLSEQITFGRRSATQLIFWAIDRGLKPLSLPTSFSRFV